MVYGQDQNMNMSQYGPLRGRRSKDTMVLPVPGTLSPVATVLATVLQVADLGMVGMATSSSRMSSTSATEEAALEVASAPGCWPGWRVVVVWTVCSKRERERERETACVLASSS